MCHVPWNWVQADASVGDGRNGRGWPTTAGLEGLCDLGAEYGQGFLIGQPAAHPMPSPCQLVEEFGVTTGRPAGVRAARPLPR